MAAPAAKRSRVSGERARVDGITRLPEPARRPAWFQRLRFERKAKRHFVRELPPG